MVNCFCLELCTHLCVMNVHYIRPLNKNDPNISYLIFVWNELIVCFGWNIYFYHVCRYLHGWGNGLQQRNSNNQDYKTNFWIKREITCSKYIIFGKNISFPLCNVCITSLALISIMVCTTNDTLFSKCSIKKLQTENA